MKCKALYSDKLHFPNCHQQQ